jgi:hypothetical protein
MYISEDVAGIIIIYYPIIHELVYKIMECVLNRKGFSAVWALVPVAVSKSYAQ